MAPAPRSTGRATHSPIIGTCPARKTGQAASSSRARLAAIFSGVVAKDIAAELGVSEDSVRRDLREMAAAGLCQRVYGGALPASPAVADYAARRSVEPDHKQRVAELAAGLIKPGDTVILDGGTTTLAVCVQRLCDAGVPVLPYAV